MILVMHAFVLVDNDSQCTEKQWLCFSHADMCVYFVLCGVQNLIFRAQRLDSLVLVSFLMCAMSTDVPATLVVPCDLGLLHCHGHGHGQEV
jgi:hypothetical protein